MRRLSFPGLVRPLRLGVPAVAVLALGLAACSDPTPAVPSAPSPAAPSNPSPAAPSDPSPAAPGTAAPASPPPSSTLTPPSGSAGSDGLTVRYLDHGSLKTVHVEDFPR